MQSNTSRNEGITQSLEQLEKRINTALQKEANSSGNYQILRVARDYITETNEIDRQRLINAMGMIQYDKCFLSIFASSTQLLLTEVLGLNESDVKKCNEAKQHIENAKGKTKYSHAGITPRFITIR